MRENTAYSTTAIARNNSLFYSNLSSESVANTWNVKAAEDSNGANCERPIRVPRFATFPVLLWI